jgi:putative IMPACT (imprinted ancient) family translation regulator
MPILDIIRKKGLTDIAIVVTRYFGGTLLGTGGLVHAYSASALGAIEAAEVITYDLYTEVSFKVSYSDYQKLQMLFSELEFRVEDTSFLADVEIVGRVVKTKLEDFEKKLIETTSGRSKLEILGEKFDF